MLNSCRLLVAAAVLCLFSLSQPQSAAAQGFASDVFRDVMRACRADYHRICPDVLPGGGRIARCLAYQEEYLSPPCLTAVKFAQAVKACTPDYFRFCPDVEPGGGRVARCLSDSLHLLAPDCRRIVRAYAPYFDDVDGFGKDAGGYELDERGYADKDDFREDRFPYRRGERDRDHNYRLDTPRDSNTDDTFENDADGADTDEDTEPVK